MEPHEPARNEEGSGYSKRRISSILKAPRKSARFPDPEQQENTVECAKPVEKRASRRVSFAPANDVLLFSKDAKNPGRSPLQELKTATGTTTQNRVPGAVPGEAIQQLTGMETLLNAPLHVSQQQEKVTFDFGEKTVMFSSDEAFMDLTHSQTINIAKDVDFFADVSLQNVDILSSAGEKTVMFTADDASMDMTSCHTGNMTGFLSLPTDRNLDLNVEKRNVSPSVLTLDAGFQDFLASLSKPSGSFTTVETNCTAAQSKTQKVDVDKENLFPFKSAAIEKSLNASKKTGESSYGGAHCPDDDMSMNLTEVHTGRILGVNDDNPFQCLFPTQDMYAKSDKSLSQTANSVQNKLQQSSKAPGRSDPEDVPPVKNPPLTSHPKNKVNFDARDERSEKTIMFTADDELMEMTQSHTVNIARGPLAPKDQEFENFLASLSKTRGPSVNPVTERVGPSAASLSKKINVNSAESQLKIPTADVAKDNKLHYTSSIGGEICHCPEDIGMDLTEAQTGRIVGFSGSDDPFQFMCPPKDMYPQKAEMSQRHKSSEAPGASDCAGMGTSVKPALKAKVQRHQDKLDLEDNYRERTVRFSADDGAMDVTRSHTVNIGTELQQHQNLDFLSSHREKTIRFNVNDAAMDMTQCLTVNIASNLVSDSVFPPMIKQSEECVPPRGRPSAAHGLGRDQNNFLTNLSHPSEPSVDLVIPRKFSKVRDSIKGVCPADDESLDMTEVQTGQILVTEDPLQCLFPTQDMYLQRGDMKKTWMTSQLQTNGSSNSKGLENSSKTFSNSQKTQVKFDADNEFRERTVRFSADDAAMDVTHCLTVNIASNAVSDAVLPNQESKVLSTDGSLDLPFAVKKKERRSLSARSLDPGFQNFNSRTSVPDCHHQVKFDAEDNLRERTVRFSADDAAMDVTNCLTVNIASNAVSESVLPNQESNILSTDRSLDLQFIAKKKDRKSLSTRSLDPGSQNSNSRMIVSDSQPQVKFDAEDNLRERTVRFSADDAAMDVTNCLTVNIASNAVSDSFIPNQESKVLSTDGSYGSLDLPFAAKKKERRSLSARSLNPGSQNFNSRTSVPDCHPQVKFNVEDNLRERTVRFSADDAAMEVTNCLTVNIASNAVSESVPNQESNILSTHGSLDLPFTAKKKERRSLSVRSLDPGSKNSLSRKSAPWATNPVINKTVTPAVLSPLEGVGTNGYLDKLQTWKPDADTENDAPAFSPATVEERQNKTIANSPENTMNMDLTEAQTGYIMGQTCTDEMPPCLSSTQDSQANSDYWKQTEAATSQQSNEALGRADLHKIETRKEPEATTETYFSSQKMERSPKAVEDTDALCSRRSRRMSLADLQSKVRRLSHMIQTTTDDIALESWTVPLPQDDSKLDKNSKDETDSVPVEEPEPDVGLINTQDDTQAQRLSQGEEASTATPFNLKTKQLMSRLSVGGFKPKLPQRSKTSDSKREISVGETTTTMAVNVSNQLSDFDNDVSDIYDEELGSYEEMSENLDARSPQKIPEKVGHSQEFDMDEPLEEEVFEDDPVGAVHTKKRPFPTDKYNPENEKRMKVSPEKITDGVEMELQLPLGECDGSVTTAPNVTTHTTDYSSHSHTASIRCEATFESTLKHSLFESQIEDHTNDGLKRLDDGSITVLEFFRLFNIDFVIHNPRQSVLPGRLQSDSERTAMDLMKDRHINRPKQMVYEENVQNLSEKVEGLKVRMRDLDKPLKIVNRPLWEEMRNCSEKELKSFGAKLKERNNLFRKMSKAKSHEMKEVLYSDLVQTNLEEQQRLRGKIEEADEMIKSLDDCICELETELAAVEEKGFEDKPSLKSCQEEMKKVTETLADNERQMTELEMQKKQNSNKLNRLKTETRNLERHVTMLHVVHEWEFGEKKENCSTYTFLHETMHLELMYEKSNGNDADKQAERKISRITFKLQLDDEKSQCHARLVHKLLSQYVESETSWVEKYPTSRHVPKLLHDVSLVVSRCRLLGEELRLLKMWGGLRLDVLDISCVDTQVRIVFSSLKKFSKFEVLFSVSLINHVCVIQVQSFKNMIGNTEKQQIEEIVASFSPGKNLLTKIVKKIHDILLY